MSDLLLAKPQLPHDWIDASVGEAHLARARLLENFDLNLYQLSQYPDMWNYIEPNGYQPLVQLLEEKYQAPVVITNGAKQGLAACFYALKQSGKSKLGMRIPYWPLILPLLSMAGLQWSFEDPILSNNCDSYLLIAPNNPDGYCYPSLQFISQQYQEAKIPLIHDAVYYNHVYLDTNIILQPIGDLQVFSASKYLGLSGLRLGWIVCHNPKYYQLLCQYQETMTVGVSVVSQIFLVDLMKRMRGYPTLTNRFEGLAFQDLTEAKKIIKTIKSDILDVPINLDQVAGMFGYFKCHRPEIFTQAKINPAKGEYFGHSDYIRLNLALPLTQITELVRRLNECSLQ